KYTHDAAAANPYPLSVLYIESVMILVIGFSDDVEISIMVYIPLSKIKGFKVGIVIFQNVCQAEAPSTMAASYILLSTFCIPDRKINNCTPHIHKHIIMLSITNIKMEEKLDGKFSI